MRLGLREGYGYFVVPSFFRYFMYKPVRTVEGEYFKKILGVIFVARI